LRINFTNRPVGSEKKVLKYSYFLCEILVDTPGFFLNQQIYYPAFVGLEIC
jgi:hypothetical protein